MLPDLMDMNLVLSDVVGLVNKATDVFPLSGNAKSWKRHVYITNGSDHAIVTLWGEQTDSLDADGLMEASNEEHVIVLFVGMTVNQNSLAFKSTFVTRWYVNPPIPEVAVVRERAKHLPWRIELQDGNMGRVEPIVPTIAEIATFQPNEIMVSCSNS